MRLYSRKSLAKPSTRKAIIGVRSNIPKGGTTRRIGARSGSVIWFSNWLIVSIIGLVSPIAPIQDMIILARIASWSAEKKRLTKFKSSSFN